MSNPKYCEQCMATPCLQETYDPRREREVSDRAKEENTLRALVDVKMQQCKAKPDSMEIPHGAIVCKK